MEINKSLEWLITECEKGNTNTFRMLFEETKDDIFRFIRFRVSTRDDALDILQETFLDLWKSFKARKFTYSSDEEFLGFLCLVARRKIIKLYRHRKPTASFEDLADTISEDSLEDPGRRHAEAGSGLAEAGEIAIILQSLDKLNGPDREVVELHCFEGLGFREIAHLLGKGESAIKIRYHRAIEKLREILGYEKEK